MLGSVGTAGSLLRRRNRIAPANPPIIEPCNLNAPVSVPSFPYPISSSDFTTAVDSLVLDVTCLASRCNEVSVGQPELTLASVQHLLPTSVLLVLRKN